VAQARVECPKELLAELEDRVDVRILKGCAPGRIQLERRQEVVLGAVVQCPHGTYRAGSFRRPDCDKQLSRHLTVRGVVGDGDARVLDQEPSVAPWQTVCRVALSSSDERVNSGTWPDLHRVVILDAMYSVSGRCARAVVLRRAWRRREKGRRCCRCTR
jgi:hypothetical protein